MNDFKLDSPLVKWIGAMTVCKTFIASIPLITFDQTMTWLFTNGFMLCLFMIPLLFVSGRIQVMYSETNGIYIKHISN